MADHGALRGDTVGRPSDDAAEVMSALANLGIDYDDMVHTLEQDGLTTFQSSWAALIHIFEGKLAAAKRGGNEDDHT